MNIRDSVLKKIFLFVFGAAILGITVINLFIYPSFTRMLIANTEAEASAVGRHMSRMVFSEYFLENGNISPESIADIDHAVQEFNLYKLKVFIPGGETVYSTETGDIGNVNNHDYFLSLVSRGRNFTKIVEKGDRSLEGQEVPVSVVETYIPHMSNGSFIGALEIYLDITEKKRMLQNTLLVCNTVSIGLTLIFSGIIMAALMQLDKNINERKKINTSLEQSNTRLNREVEVRKQIQQEKENLINRLQSSLAKVKLLSGFLPICASCKKIRDDNGYWNQIETYIREHSEAEFSHGMCPECAQEHYPEFYKANSMEVDSDPSVNSSAAWD